MRLQNKKVRTLRDLSLRTRSPHKNSFIAEREWKIDNRELLEYPTHKIESSLDRSFEANAEGLQRKHVPRRKKFHVVSLARLRV